MNRVVADDRVLEEALAWAEQLCDVAPIALGHMKHLVRAAPGLGYLETMKAEARLQSRCIDSQDFTEGVTAFREKRAAKFKGK